MILVEQLNIAPERLQKIVRILHDHNLNGLALYSCNMLELKDILKLPLGDWTMFHLLIETLRRFSTEGLPSRFYLLFFPVNMI